MAGMINDDCAFSLQKLFFIIIVFFPNFDSINLKTQWRITGFAHLGNRTTPIDNMVGSRVLYLGHSNFVISLI